MRWRNRLALAVAALAASLPCAAGNSCNVSIQDVIFGDYDASNPVAAVTSAEVRVSCQKLTTLEILLSTSTVSGSVLDRRMRHQSRPDTLSYNIFREASMSSVWGDSAQGNRLVLKVQGDYVTRIYAQIFPRQDVWIGSYADTLRVTVLQ
jgi:spore coat protein U-like protein